MTDWFRSWHGAPTDPKWLGIARKAGVAPGMVVAVAWALMDRASQAEDRGDIDGYDPDGLACFFGCDPEQIDAIVRGMADRGVIVNGRFAAWEKRQPKREDDSAERVREFRRRQKQASTERDTSNGNDVKRDVTQRNAPETETETEADTEIEHRSNDISVAPRAIETPRPTDAEAEALIEAADRAISEHFPGRRRRRHANDLAIARGWAERRIGPDRIAVIVSAQVERHRVLKPDDMPSSLRFFEAEVDRAEPPPQYPPGIASDDDRQWYDLVVAWKVKGVWITRRGAKPDDPATMVPDHVLAAHGLTRRKVRAA